MLEFNLMVKKLRQEKIEVEVIEFNYQEPTLETLDAVFPNNWFSTTSD
ncbi:arginine deiminase-related protein [Candidatus Photodesmus katoptron]|nr:arginine deiminase-related protein [Candidatus Photodesmus katoptron]